MRLFSRLSGDDIFISYSRRDGSLYAAGLADELTQKKFSCFIDKLGTKPDHDLPPDLIRKIKNCSILVIVGTERAAQSVFIQKEIRVFKETGRTILPIDFDENVSKAIWYDDIPGLAVESESNPEALDKGDPSDNVVRFIEKSFNYTRRNRYMARSLWAAVALFIVLTSVGLGSFLIFSNEANNQRVEAANARAEAANAKIEANTAQQETDKARLAANTATNTAIKQQKRADEEEYRAKVQESIADAKTVEAKKATDLAAEKTSFAESETKRATAATDAADKAREGLGKSQRTVADNYYNISLTAAKIEPINALPWVGKALEAAPDASIFRIWALNLVNDIPRFIINPFAGKRPEIMRSSADNALITISESGQLRVWSTKTGREFPNPLADCQCELFPLEGNHFPAYTESSDTGLPFSPDGKFIAVVTKGPQNNEQRFRVWETETGADVINESVSVEGLSFSADSKNIITTTYANQPLREMKIWDLKEKRVTNLIYGDTTPLFPEISDSQPLPGVSNPAQRLPISLRVSSNPERNWMLNFEQEGEIGVVRDIASGKPIGHRFPIPNGLEFIDFSGAASKIVAVFRDENKGRMISAFNIETGELPEATRFAICFSRSCEIGQELRILGFSKDDNRILLNAPNTTLDVWGINEKRLVKQYDFLSVKKNLRGFFSADERRIVTIEDDPTSTSENTQHIVRIIDAEDQNRPEYYPNLKDLINVAKSGTAYYRMGNESIHAHDLEKQETSTFEKKLSVKEDECLFKIYKTPDGKAALGFYQSPCYGQQTQIKMQLWDLSTGKPIWKSGEAILGSGSMRSPGNTLKEVVLDSKGRRFVTIFQEDGSQGYNATKTPKVLTVWDTKSGTMVEGYSPIPTDIQGASFSQNDSVLMTIDTMDSGAWKIQKRNPLTGDSLDTFSAVKPVGNWQFKTFLGNGRYILMAPPDGPFNQRFSRLRILDLNTAQHGGKEFVFRDAQSASLAIAILKSARGIALENDSVKVELTSGPAVVISESGEITILSKEGAASRIYPPPEFDIMKEEIRISPDGRLILKITKYGISLSDTKTGVQIINNINIEPLFCEFSNFGEKIFTITSQGEMGSIELAPETTALNGARPWIFGIGEALGGTRIVNGAVNEKMSQNQYLQLREEYLNRLRISKREGDKDAEFILEKWNP